MSMIQRPFSWSGAATIVLVGSALGLLHNHLGLAGKPPRGLPWVARPAEVPVVVATAPPGAAADYRTDMADPMAVAAPAGQGITEFPCLDRPVEIGLAALKERLDAHAVLVVDAREPGEFDLGHIPGALSLPHDEVVSDPGRVLALDPAGRPIVTYCGGGGCELSRKLAEELLGAGQRCVGFYEGGFPEWVAAGYPVERAGE